MICCLGDGDSEVDGGYIAGAGVEWMPLLDFADWGGGERFFWGDRPFCEGGSVGVETRGLELGQVAFSCGVERPAGMLLVLCPDEKDTDGVESVGRLFAAASRGCLRGESDLAGTEGTVTSA